MPARGVLVRSEYSDISGLLTHSDLRTVFRPFFLARVWTKVHSSGLQDQEVVPCDIGPLTFLQPSIRSITQDTKEQGKGRNSMGA